MVVRRLAVQEAKRTIRELIENRVLWRDADDWERFHTLWHRDGWMTATWFQGPAEEFIAVSQAGFENGVSILHFLGSTAINIGRKRAIGQTKVTILQRGILDGAEVDVDCIRRFYDFFEKREGRWAIVRRQPIYEKDRMIAVRPGETVKLDADILARFPVGYRHLGYLQAKAGFDVKLGLPGLVGDAVDRLYEEGRASVAGSERPRVPL
jgi:hypothetical protein